MPAEPEPPELPESFQDFGFPVPLQHALGNAGLNAPFPIQQHAIPVALSGRDVLGRAPTGSGKTLAFGLPILARLNNSEIPRTSPAGHPRSIILCPTRELAEQIFNSLDLLAASLGLCMLLLVGGAKIKHNLTSLAQTVDIVVATPGRVIDLLHRKALGLSHCAMSVVDEADHLADLGFLPQISEILDATPTNSQRLFFSATLDKSTATLVKRYLHNPKVIEALGAPDKPSLKMPTSSSPQTHKTRHIICPIDDGPSKRRVITALAKRVPRTIFFLRTTHGVGRLAQKLSAEGIRVSSLHGNRGHESRKRSLADFSQGRTKILVCTDIAARGIDISEVPLVVHIDAPEDPKAFVHRSGRTARAGSSGTVVTLAFPDQLPKIKEFLRKSNMDFESIPPQRLLSEVIRQ